MADSNQRTLIAKVMQGVEHRITVDFDAPVESVRRRLAELERMEPEKLKLIFRGRILKDGTTLDSYGMPDEAKIFVVKTQRGEVRQPPSRSGSTGAADQTAPSTGASEVTQTGGAAQGVPVFASGLPPATMALLGGTAPSVQVQVRAAPGASGPDAVRIAQSIAQSFAPLAQQLAGTLASAGVSTGGVPVVAGRQAATAAPAVRAQPTTGSGHGGQTAGQTGTQTGAQTAGAQAGAQAGAVRTSASSPGRASGVAHVHVEAQARQHRRCPDSFTGAPPAPAPRIPREGDRLQAIYERASSLVRMGMMDPGGDAERTRERLLARVRQLRDATTRARESLQDCARRVEAYPTSGNLIHNAMSHRDTEAGVALTELLELDPLLEALGEEYVKLGLQLARS